MQDLLKRTNISYVKKYAISVGFIINILSDGAYSVYMNEPENVDKLTADKDVQYNKVYKVVKKCKNLSKHNYVIRSLRNRFVHRPYDFIAISNIDNLSGLTLDDFTDYIFEVAKYINYPTDRDEIKVVCEYLLWFINICVNNVNK